MGICPVCEEDWPIPDEAMNEHVESHFSSSGGGQIEDRGQSQWIGMGRELSTERWVDGSDKFMSASSSSRPSRVASPVDDSCCPVCNFPLSLAEPADRTAHVNDCLDGRKANHDSPTFPSLIDLDDEPIPPRHHTGETGHDTSQWEGPAQPGGWTKWVGKPVHKADQWWDPVSGSSNASDIPPCFSPGLLPVLSEILNTALARGMTRSAVISRETVHMSSVKLFDWGWGCGYRNALMALSALLLANPSYRKPFSTGVNGAEPGVRRVQGWLEEMWADGFDAPGASQMHGKALGTRKWIGTGDLYAMFTWKGIPCQLYDFKKPERGQNIPAAHVRLQSWVKKYFLGSSVSSGNAFNTIMRTQDGGQGRGEAVRLSPQLPLVLQHNGHSRTIIGYEENSHGDVNLLIFDPGLTMKKSIRNAGLTNLKNRPRAIDTPLTPPPPALISKSSFTRQQEESHESLAFAPPYTNGAAEIVHFPEAGPTRSYTVRKTSGSSFGMPGLKAKPSMSMDMDAVRVKGGSKRSGSDIRLEEDEEMDGRGWVRKKLGKVLKGPGLGSNSAFGLGGKGSKDKWELPEALNHFRVNLRTLGNHADYQVLAFTGGPLLSDSERMSRKSVKSVAINKLY